MDDSRIRFLKGGDPGAYPTPKAQNDIQRRYVREFLEPLCAQAGDETPPGGIYVSLLGTQKAPKPPADLPVQALLDAIVPLEPFPPVTVQIEQAHPELRGLARCPSQKAGALRWLQGLVNRQKTSGREAYEEKRSLLCLVWLAEALGEKREALHRAIMDALSHHTMPERCDAFRKAIPFDRIIDLTETPQRWLREKESQT